MVHFCFHMGHSPRRPQFVFRVCLTHPSAPATSFAALSLFKLRHLTFFFHFWRITCMQNWTLAYALHAIWKCKVKLLVCRLKRMSWIIWLSMSLAPWYLVQLIHSFMPMFLFLGHNFFFFFFFFYQWLSQDCTHDLNAVWVCHCVIRL